MTMTSFSADLIVITNLRISKLYCRPYLCMQPGELDLSEKCDKKLFSDPSLYILEGKVVHLEGMTGQHHGERLVTAISRFTTMLK